MYCTRTTMIANTQISFRTRGPWATSLTWAEVPSNKQSWAKLSYQQLVQKRIKFIMWFNHLLFSIKNWIHHLLNKVYLGMLHAVCHVVLEQTSNFNYHHPRKCDKFADRQIDRWQTKSDQNSSQAFSSGELITNASNEVDQLWYVITKKKKLCVQNKISYLCWCCKIFPYQSCSY